MNSRLEEKLAAYEENIPITNDEELLLALDTIIEEQEKLPPEEKDETLISEAIDASLSLRGEDLRELEKLSRELASKHIAVTKKKRTSSPMIVRFGRRGIAVAAALAVIMMTSIIGFAAGYDWISELYNRIMNVDNSELMVVSESIEYENLSDMVADFNLKDVLLPHSLPDGLSYKMMTGQAANSKAEDGTLFAYKIFDIRTTGDCTWQEICIETENLGTTAEGEMRNIGGREVTYYLDGARHCAFFGLDGYTYTLSATEYSELEALLKALR